MKNRHIHDEKQMMADIMLYLAGNQKLFRTHIKERKVRRNEVFHTDSDYFYIVKKGAFVSELSSDKGNTHSLMLYSEMQIFGRSDSQSSIAVSRALTESILYQIDRDFMIDHLYVQPDLFRSVTNVFFHLTEDFVRMMALSNMKPQDKIICTLYLLIKRIGLDREGNSFQLPSYITQSLVSTFCRTKKFTVTKEYQRLISEGYLEINGREVIVLDFQRIEDYLIPFSPKQVPVFL
ncbi:cyclic nucleotide-binding domain-containing protein [Listeria floridensis FSL S10-1187]|uniref:Cyclic nucleotide-binding domain-containing protein n=1 Tax=Listeria floridensis FSL S10-1187 TaxID=1265817 RepID=A0ABN0RDD3_9LIST|nr:Crp/Fnr family transcriptional regulator [Listeria floridensis]EUJ28847.1 cyclic nucleotide-binding domain-containing protein [Listeria floridensis FSL S10-1187]